MSGCELGLYVSQPLNSISHIMNIFKSQKQYEDLLTKQANHEAEMTALKTQHAQEIAALKATLKAESENVELKAQHILANIGIAAEDLPSANIDPIVSPEHLYNKWQALTKEDPEKAQAFYRRNQAVIKQYALK